MRYYPPITTQMDVSQLGTLPHHKPPLVVCCRLVLLVSGLADGHLVRWATVPAARTSPGDTVALLVVPPSAQGTPWPWQPRGRWRKWVVVRYRAAQRTCQQATWARPPPWGAIAAAWRADHVDGVRLADLGPTPASVGCFARPLSTCLKNKKPPVILRRLEASCPTSTRVRCSSTGFRRRIAPLFKPFILIAGTRRGYACSSEYVEPFVRALASDSAAAARTQSTSSFPIMGYSGKVTSREAIASVMGRQIPG